MTSGTEGGSSPAAQLVLRPAGPAQRRPGPGRGARIWRVSANGDVEAVGWQRPATGPASEPHLIGRVLHRRPRRGRWGPAALMPAPPAGTRPQRTAVAGLGVALLTVGLVAAVATAGPPPVPAAAGSTAPGVPPAVLQALPPLPTDEFVYPILPVPPAVPVLPTGASPGLLLPGPGPQGPVPAVPVLPAIPPPSLVPTIPTSVASGPLREGQAAGPGGAGQNAVVAPTRAPSTPPPPAVPPAAQPLPTPPLCTAAPVTPLADVPVEVRLPGSEPEPLLRAEHEMEELPHVDCGDGIGLWSGSTERTSVLVLGAEHPAAAELRLGSSAVRSIVVRRGVGSVETSYTMGENKQLTRDEARALLAGTDAPLLLFVTVGDVLVTVAEAR